MSDESSGPPQPGGLKPPAPRVPSALGKEARSAEGHAQKGLSVDVPPRRLAPSIRRIAPSAPSPTEVAPAAAPPAATPPAAAGTPASSVPEPELVDAPEDKPSFLIEDDRERTAILMTPAVSGTMPSPLGEPHEPPWGGQGALTPSSRPMPRGYPAAGVPPSQSSQGGWPVATAYEGAQAVLEGQRMLERAQALLQQGNALLQQSQSKAMPVSTREPHRPSGRDAVAQALTNTGMHAAMQYPPPSALTHDAVAHALTNTGMHAAMQYPPPSVPTAATSPVSSRMPAYGPVHAGGVPASVQHPHVAPMQHALAPTQQASAPTGPTLISMRNIGKSYTRGGESLQILVGLNLEVPSGSYQAFMGPSGSGKSTLLNLIAGLDTPTNGEILIDGKNITAMSDAERARWRSENIGFIFQSYNLLPVLTAVENVELPLLLTKLPKSERRRRAETALRLVGLEERMRHYPRQLSGGQEQRVAIARAIVNDPVLLVADEPTGDLDRASADAILLLLEKLNTELGKTIVMVTHDDLAARRAHLIRRLDKGALI